MTYKSLASREKRERHARKISRMQRLILCSGLITAIFSGSAIGLISRADDQRAREAAGQKEFGILDAVRAVPQIMAYLDRDEAREITRDRHMGFAGGVEVGR